MEQPTHLEMPLPPDVVAELNEYAQTIERDEDTLREAVRAAIVKYETEKEANREH